MQRLKILGGSILFLIMVYALTSGVNSSISLTDSKNLVSTTQPKNNLFDQKKAVLYTLQQQELKAAIKAYFDKAIASGSIIGAGVSIVRGDSIVISDGFGKRNIRTNGDVDSQTMFRLGSLSKGFAGILAANLVDEGKLDWKDKVSEYVPEFQLGDRSNTDKITLANILSHTSGAPYHSYTNLVEAGLSLTEIAKRFKEVQPISNPGAVYSYQNALFALSEKMMYKATGQTITKSLENRFFNPLEMCSTTMNYESLAHKENVAIPHSKRRNSWKPKKLRNNYYNAIAAGGISANAQDMAKWMRFLLGHNPEIMRKSALEKTFNQFIEIKGHSKYYQRWPGHVSSHYGFGWRIHKFVEDDSSQEKTIWHHGGSVNNYRNEIAVFPEADIGICVLLNNNSRLAKTVIPDLYKIVQ
ncbi:serine hydrolase, partial [uncultured Muriicola sp.]|uniref:serine hydrolase domain-containing protein n=1 Tax=uncultured Muriicola sp. TaxID=1583102 RepID=UPI00261430AF